MYYLDTSRHSDSHTGTLPALTSLAAACLALGELQGYRRYRQTEFPRFSPSLMRPAHTRGVHYPKKVMIKIIHKIKSGLLDQISQNRLPFPWHARPHVPIPRKSTASVGLMMQCLVGVIHYACSVVYLASFRLPIQICTVVAYELLCFVLGWAGS